MAKDKGQDLQSGKVLDPEQESLLDQYIEHLDVFYEGLKRADAIQVEIETQHLKKILST